MTGQTTKQRHVIRDEDDSDAWVEVEHDASGRIIRLVHFESEAELDTPRYQPERWVETTYTWRPRLKVYDVVQRANDLYPGKPDHVWKSRATVIPTGLLPPSA